MAKQLVNPLERHVEKAVVGVAGVILIGVIAQYVVSSPNRLELSGESVTPRTIDEKVAKRAEDTRQRIRSAQPKAQTPAALAPKFGELLQPLNSAPLVAAAPWGAEVPLIDPPINVVGKASLVKVVRPEKPAVSFGRSTVVVPAEPGKPPYVPTNWVTVSAVFDHKAQTDLQKLTYGASQGSIVMASPAIQRRAMRSDGTWSDSDWGDVDAWPTAETPKPPELTPDGIAELTDVDKRALEKFREFLQQGPNQVAVVRPRMADVVNGTRWSPPSLVPYRDLLLMDDQYFHPDDPPAAEPEDRYGFGAQPKATTTASPETPAAVLKEVERLLKEGKQNKDKAAAFRAHDLASQLSEDRTTSASDREKAEKLMVQAKQLDSDIRREELIGGAGAVRPGGPGGTTEVRKRDPMPKQQLWVHDARAGSIRDGRGYQYRLRFKILNQFAAQPEKFDRPADAAVVQIAGEWSEASDPITFEPSFSFYVTSDDKSRREINVEFFQWYYGAWLKSRRVKFSVGDRLAERQRIEAPDLSDASKVDRPEVSFDGGGVVVDIDFDRPLRERRASASPTGVKFGGPRPETAAVYVDDDGRLHQRLVAVDKSHPDKQKITAKLYRPPRQP
ncbi:MAG: hypothetical protein AABZ12_13520 [Planctomycetota bacterium]